MGNYGRWDRVFRRADPSKTVLYGSETTYRHAAHFLRLCHQVEDWGCGLGGFRRFREQCIGVDSSKTPFADIKADLVNYQPEPSTDGILIRHVLENNEDWRSILLNAQRGENVRRICVILFTPMQEETRILRWNRGKMWEVPVPDIGFKWEDLLSVIDRRWHVETQDLVTVSKHKFERVIKLTRPLLPPTPSEPLSVFD